MNGHTWQRRKPPRPRRLAPKSPARSVTSGRLTCTPARASWSSGALPADISGGCSIDRRRRTAIADRASVADPAAEHLVNAPVDKAHAAAAEKPAVPASTVDPACALWAAKRFDDRLPGQPRANASPHTRVRRIRILDDSAGQSDLPAYLPIRSEAPEFAERLAKPRAYGHICLIPTDAGERFFGESWRIFGGVADHGRDDTLAERIG